MKVLFVTLNSNNNSDEGRHTDIEREREKRQEYFDSRIVRESICTCDDFSRRLSIYSDLIFVIIKCLKFRK